MHSVRLSHTACFKMWIMHQSSVRYIYAECRQTTGLQDGGAEGGGAPFLLIFKSMYNLPLPGEKTPEASHQRSDASFSLKPGTSCLHGPMTTKTLYTLCSGSCSKTRSRHRSNHCIWLHSLSDLWQRVKEPRSENWDDRKNHSNARRGAHGEAKLHSIMPALAKLEKGIQGNRQGEWTISLFAISEPRPTGKTFWWMPHGNNPPQWDKGIRIRLLSAPTFLPWASALFTLNTLTRATSEPERHARSPLIHCFPALSMCLFSGVLNSQFPILILFFRPDILPVSPGVTLVLLDTDPENPRLQLFLSPWLSRPALGLCSLGHAQSWPTPTWKQAAHSSRQMAENNIFQEHSDSHSQGLAERVMWASTYTKFYWGSRVSAAFQWEIKSQIWY